MVLVGDPAYPLTTWLMKAYAFRGNLARDHKHFNYRLSRARIVTETASGRPKACWQRLLKQNDMQIHYVTKMGVACCVLHNGDMKISNLWLYGNVYKSHDRQQTASHELVETFRFRFLAERVTCNVWKVTCATVNHRSLAVRNGCS